MAALELGPKHHAWVKDVTDGVIDPEARIAEINPVGFQATAGGGASAAAASPAPSPAPASGGASLPTSMAPVGSEGLAGSGDQLALESPSPGAPSASGKPDPLTLLLVKVTGLANSCSVQYSNAVNNVIREFQGERDSKAKVEGLFGDFLLAVLIIEVGPAVSSAVKLCADGTVGKIMGVVAPHLEQSEAKAGVDKLLELAGKVTVEYAGSSNPYNITISMLEDLQRKFVKLQSDMIGSIEKLSFGELVGQLAAFQATSQNIFEAHIRSQAKNFHSDVAELIAYNKSTWTNTVEEYVFTKNNDVVYYAVVKETVVGSARSPKTSTTYELIKWIDDPEDIELAKKTAHEVAYTELVKPPSRPTR